MIALLVSLVLRSQFKDCPPTKYYVTPRLDLINDQRMTWDLRGTRYTITAPVGNDYYGRRYLQFHMSSSHSNGLDGQANIWSGERLDNLQILNPSRMKILRKRKSIIVVEQEGYVSRVLWTSKHDYYLYVQLSEKGDFSRSMLATCKSLLKRIRLGPPEVEKSHK